MCISLQDTRAAMPITCKAKTRHVFAMTTSGDVPKKIIFVHPDLGIGGAERLVVDAAVGLQSRGHKVTILTSHCDRSHCFEEARDGRCSFSTILKRQTEGFKAK